MASSSDFGDMNVQQQRANILYNCLEQIQKHCGLIGLLKKINKGDHGLFFKLKFVIEFTSFKVIKTYQSNDTINHFLEIVLTKSN